MPLSPRMRRTAGWMEARDRARAAPARCSWSVVSTTQNATARRPIVPQSCPPLVSTVHMSALARAVPCRRMSFTSITRPALTGAGSSSARSAPLSSTSLLPVPRSQADATSTRMPSAPTTAAISVSWATPRWLGLSQASSTK